MSDLFPLHPLPPHQKRSRTSKDAAVRIEPSTQSLRTRVWLYLVACGSQGATDEQGEDATSLEGSTYRPRRVELQELGRVLDSGKTRPTRSGRQATIWVVPPGARP